MIMCKDGYDKLCWILLTTIMVAMVVVLYNGAGVAGRDKQAAHKGKTLEREMAYRAKLELIAKIYEPVDSLRKAGNSQTALLKLDELIRKYPGEAHGHILRGDILQSMGVLDEAISSYVEGIKLNGDYVDAKSPLSRRTDVLRVVDEGMKSIAQRSAVNPGNSSVAAVRQKINYLKSRLAGGCE